MSGTAQLSALGEIDALLARLGIDYWLFGGWAVDFHVGRVTREHDDLDIAVWRSDFEDVDAALRAADWSPAQSHVDQGFVAYKRDLVALEVAFLACDERGDVFTPTTGEPGTWPAGAFGDDEAELNGVRARVISLASLIQDKSEKRDDPRVAAKDRADRVALGV